MLDDRRMLTALCKGLFSREMTRVVRIGYRKWEGEHMACWGNRETEKIKKSSGEKERGVSVACDRWA